MKLYCIESHADYYGDHFRYRSLYNGAVGSWHCKAKDKAIEDGEKHQEIILMLHGKNQSSELTKD